MALLISRLFQSIQAGLLCLLLSSVYTPHTVRAQTPDKFTLNPVTNFCQRWWSQSVVKNDILHIDSGLQKWNVTGVSSRFLGINSWMITIPLNVTWDWKDPKSIKIDAQAKGENAKNPNTGTAPPSLIRGHMFHGPLDEPNVYVYGGTTYMGNTSFETFAWPGKIYYTWSYTYGAKYPWAQWTSDVDVMPNHGAAAEAIDQNLGFYLNGQIDWGSTGSTADLFLKTLDAYTPIEGMVVLDFDAQSVKNISTSGLRDGVPRVAGTMEYLGSVGAMGVLVALGGQIQPSLTSTFANSSQGSLIDFGTVDVFDIDSYLQKPETSGAWYSQNTTGEIPPPRVDFCTVAISSADNSSHHIYLYGGYNPITNVAYDDMFVLTLPSFTWTNLWRRGESPRWGHKCHIAGKRQMISVGGNTPLNECDWELKGVAVWDLTALTWGSVFVADALDFQVPRKLHNVTGGNESGNATVKDPALGWTNPGLKTVFATRSKNAPSGNTSTGNSPSGSGSGAPTSKSKSNTGAIAGGVGGGVGAIVVIALVAFYYRRHQKRHRPHELADNSAPADQASYFPKSKFELHAINENSPAELYGHEIRELETPRQAVEADPHSSPRGAELSGTTTAPGALHGVPIVRTPGDDLPVQPEYVPGLRRPSRERRRSASVSSNNEQSDQPRPANTNTNGEETVIEQKIEEGESTAGKKSEKGEDAEEQKSESVENAVEPKSKDEKDNGEEKTECE